MKKMSLLEVVKLWFYTATVVQDGNDVLVLHEKSGRELHRFSTIAECDQYIQDVGEQWRRDKDCRIDFLLPML